MSDTAEHQPIDASGRKRRPDEERFWEKVDAHGDCWEWTARRNPLGYGRFTAYRGPTYYAHRFAYQCLVGPIPDGMVLDHLCRNPSCVNPDHLEVVTLTENNRRGYGATTANGKKSHCKRGHPFSPGNTYVVKGRWRGCRICTLEKNRRSYRRAKERANG